VSPTFNIEHDLPESTKAIGFKAIGRARQCLSVR
jgi:hypothetical protein